MELLNELHPNYTRDVMEFISRDPAKQARQRMLLRILAKANLQKILLVSHHMGAGQPIISKSCLIFTKEEHASLF